VAMVQTGKNRDGTIGSEVDGLNLSDVRDLGVGFDSLAQELRGIAALRRSQQQRGSQRERERTGATD